jgi:hypothetical protein
MVVIFAFIAEGGTTHTFHGCNCVVITFDDVVAVGSLAALVGTVGAGEEFADDFEVSVIGFGVFRLWGVEDIADDFVEKGDFAAHTLYEGVFIVELLGDITLPTIDTMFMFTDVHDKFFIVSVADITLSC